MDEELLNEYIIIPKKVVREIVKNHLEINDSDITKLITMTACLEIGFAFWDAGKVLKQRDN